MKYKITTTALLLFILIQLNVFATESTSFSKDGEILATLFSEKSTWRADEDITIIASVYFPSNKTNTILRISDGEHFFMKTADLLNSGAIQFKYPDGSVSPKPKEQCLTTLSISIPSHKLTPGSHKLTLQGAILTEPLVLSIE